MGTDDDEEEEEDEQTRQKRSRKHKNKKKDNKKSGKGKKGGKALNKGNKGGNKGREAQRGGKGGKGNKKGHNKGNKGGNKKSREQRKEERHKIVTSTFTVGPLQLEVSKTYGEGKARTVRTAKASTDVMSGTMVLKVKPDGSPHVKKVVFKKPEQVDVLGSISDQKKRSDLPEELGEQDEADCG